MNEITMKPEIIKKLKKEIEKERKQSLKDCWEYHGKLIEAEGPNPKVKKSELLDFLSDMSLEDWEDVAFYVGYLRGLEWLDEKLGE